MPANTDPARSQTAIAFSEWLRARMEASGYSTIGDRPRGQARLAKDAGVTASILSRALGGLSVPSPTMVLQLAAALGANVSEALRTAGYGELAAHIEAVTKVAPQGDLSRDAIAARISHASELSSEQRAWLIGYYERRIKAIGAEIDDLIRFTVSAEASGE